MTQQRDDAISSRAAEKVDGFEDRQPLPEEIEKARDCRCAGAARSRRGAGASERTIQIVRERVIGVLPDPSELFHQRIIVPGVQAVSGEHACVAAGAVHLGLEPLEVLARRGRVG